MGCRPAFAATQVNLFEGTCYLTPVLGAWLADAHWGRYKTILVFSGIYFVVSPLCSTSGHAAVKSSFVDRLQIHAYATTQLSHHAGWHCMPKFDCNSHTGIAQHTFA